VPDATGQALTYLHSRENEAEAIRLEGIVSKRLSAPYRSAPSRDWIKVKNPDSPADDPGAGCGVVTRWQQ
jgi:ATP-dependent DNA ligase